ncbi:MAG: cell division protein FtsA, partial [Synergistota bacterium]|nr:cell division protein FtsA [Synergistota bacterium]
AASHPVGGNHITNDIRSVFGVSLKQADSLKRAVSLAEDAESLKDQLVFEEEDIDFSCSAGEVVDVIAARVEEIFEYFVIPAISDVFEKHSTSEIPVVIAGGVAASAGIEPFLEGFLQMPVRLGYPLDSDSMPPEKNDASYSLCCGITRFVSRKAEKPWLFWDMPAGGASASARGAVGEDTRRTLVRDRPQRRKGGVFHSMVSMLRKVFSELF